MSHNHQISFSSLISKRVERYTYDSNGNRVSATVNGVTSNASYTLDDQIQVYGNNTYTYDDDGYLVQKATPEGVYNYTYGSLGELRSVTTPTANIEYLYNANNQRVAKKVNGTIVEKYLWANLTTLLAIYDKDDNLIQRFEYSDGRMPTSMTQNNTKYYLHYDQVGSLRAISDTSGNIIKEITYDTYGNILTDTNANFKVSFGFAGGLLDKDTGLTRFGYRDYDSYTGKWTAKDPIDFSGGDTNLYGYVLGDPVNFVDPRGLDDPAAGLQPYFNGPIDQNSIDNWNNSKKSYGSNYPNQFPDGPFGSICGSGSSASWIPDVCPKACQKHDDCYGTHGASKDQCDFELYKSFPPYGAAVYLFGRDPYNNAQKNSNPKR